MVAKAAKVLIFALEAAVLLTAFAQNLEDPLTHATIGVMGAIAVLIMDMTMVAMIVARMTTTTSAATLRAMGPRLRRGDAGGGITRAVMGKLVRRSLGYECIITFLALSAFLVLCFCLRYVLKGCMYGYDTTRPYEIYDDDDSGILCKFGLIADGTLHGGGGGGMHVFVHISYSHLFSWLFSVSSTSR
jgi:hypothetical protein